MLIDEIRARQKNNSTLQEVIKGLEELSLDFMMINRYLRFNEIRFPIFQTLKGAHCSRYALHLGGAKEYQGSKGNILVE